MSFKGSSLAHLQTGGWGHRRALSFLGTLVVQIIDEEETEEKMKNFIVCPKVNNIYPWE